MGPRVNKVRPGNQVGPDNQVGPENQVLPENQVVLKNQVKLGLRISLGPGIQWPAYSHIYVYIYVYTYIYTYIYIYILYGSGSLNYIVRNLREDIRKYHMHLLCGSVCIWGNPYCPSKVRINIQSK